MKKVKMSMYVTVKSGDGLVNLKLEKLPRTLGCIDFLELSKYMEEHIQRKASNPKANYEPYSRYVSPDNYKKILSELGKKVRFEVSPYGIPVTDGSGNYLLVIVQGS